MSRDGLRAADADRERVAEQLRAALEEGRLDLSEFDERLQAAYAAKTYGDLDVLLADLPVQGPLVPAHPVTAPVPAPEADARGWLRHTWVSWARTSVFLTVLWLLGALGGGLGEYWPVWVIGPWGLVLAWRTVSGLSSGEPRRYAAEREHARQLQEFKRERRALQIEAVARGEFPASPSKEQRRAFEAQEIAASRLRPRPQRP